MAALGYEFWEQVSIHGVLDSIGRARAVGQPMPDANYDPTMENQHLVEGSTGTASTSAASSDDIEIEDELLIEEISIDGMCGVY